MRTSALILFLAIAQTSQPVGELEPVDTDVNVDAATKIAIESISRQIDELRNRGGQKVRLTELLLQRGNLWSTRTNALEFARGDYDEVLKLDPENVTAQLALSLYYQRQGQTELADSWSNRAAWTLWLKTSLQSVGIQTRSPMSFSAWTGTLFIWLIVSVLNIRVGWPQTIEARGSLWRLLWTSGCLGGIQTLPAVVAAEFVSQGSISDAQMRCAGISIVIGWLLTSNCLLPPVRMLGTSAKLPLMTDADFLERMHILAKQMGISIPLFRLWPSVSGSQNALAFVGTLQAPQIVVTDGIMNRLRPEERDAILAHEMAHIANGSLWILAAITPVSLAILTASIPLLLPTTVLPFAIALFVGVRRLVSRPVEFNCDFRAAKAVGFRTTSTALAKIHAALPIANTGLLSVLLYATATHP